MNQVYIPQRKSVQSKVQADALRRRRQERLATLRDGATAIILSVVAYGALYVVAIGAGY